MPMSSMHGPILSAFVNSLSFGLIILAEDGRPVLVNRSAQQLIAEENAFYTDRSGGLRACQTAADKQLQEAIGKLVSSGSTRHFQPILIRGETSAPICAWLTNLPTTEGADDSRMNCRLVSILLMQASHQSVTPEILSSLFALTRAESRLLLALLQGHSPADYARTQKLSQNTIRNQLKSIFDKTDVRRQCDLVGLVLSLLAPLDFGASNRRRDLQENGSRTTTPAV